MPDTSESPNGALRTHRFALSICGGVALGAYEAGVVSQLYRDISDLNAHSDIAGRARVSIDAISGASAGSITGVILAQAIGLGLDPDELERLMRICWIELLDIHSLLAAAPNDKTQSIYSDHVVDEIMRRALQIPPTEPTEPQQPIALWLTMTNLDGVPFAVDFNRNDHAQPGSTVLYALDYKDYVPFLISGAQIETVTPRMLAETNGDPAAENWNLAASAARASSAFPIAFPPSYQGRDLTQYPDYMEFMEVVEDERTAECGENHKGDSNAPLPTSARFQFADGGLFSNQPIGRCIDAVTYLNRLFPERDPSASESKSMAGRSFVIIDAVPQTPQVVEEALAQAVADETSASLPPSILGKILGAYFNTAVYSDFRTAEQTNRTVRSMRAVLAKLDDLGLPPEQVANLKREILKAAELDDKDEITLQRIPGSTSAGRRLAGEFAGHFGGFFRTDYREADFITGRSEARQWFEDWLMLWLKDHASDIGKISSDIDSAYISSLLQAPPPDPQDVPIPPTELTPEQLGSSNWFPNVDEDGRVSYVDRLAALNTIQRRDIVALAESRLLVLLQSWFHVPPLLARPESFIVSHFLSPMLVDEPNANK